MYKIITIVWNKCTSTSGLRLLDPAIYDIVIGVDAHIIALVNNSCECEYLMYQMCASLHLQADQNVESLYE